MVRLSSISDWAAGPGYDNTIGLGTIVLLLAVFMVWPLMTTVVLWRIRRAQRRRYARALLDVTHCGCGQRVCDGVWTAQCPARWDDAERVGS